MMDIGIWIGAMRADLGIPGARSRKDRRQAVRRLVDRMRHRFEVSVHEVDDGSQWDRAVLAIATTGQDRRLIQSILDRCEDLLDEPGNHVLNRIHSEVFMWQNKDGLDKTTFY